MKSPNDRPHPKNLNYSRGRTTCKRRPSPFLLFPYPFSAEAAVEGPRSVLDILSIVDSVIADCRAVAAGGSSSCPTGHGPTGNVLVGATSSSSPPGGVEAGRQGGSSGSRKKQRRNSFVVHHHHHHAEAGALSRLQSLRDESGSVVDGDDGDHVDDDCDVHKHHQDEHPQGQ